MRLIELSLIQIPSVIWSPIAWVWKPMWKLKLSCRRDFGLGCLCYGGNTWAAPELWPAVRNRYQAGSEIFRSVSLGDANSLSVKAFWNNLGFLCMIFPRIWSLRNLRGLGSLLVKTGLGIHTQTVMLMETSVSPGSRRVPLLPSGVSQVSPPLLWSGIFKAGQGTPARSAVEGSCYISWRQIFVNPSASTVFYTVTW